jgi:hypothetical protein
VKNFFFSKILLTFLSFGTQDALEELRRGRKNGGITTITLGAFDMVRIHHVTEILGWQAALPIGVAIAAGLLKDSLVGQICKDNCVIGISRYLKYIFVDISSRQVELNEVFEKFPKNLTICMPIEKATTGGGGSVHDDDEEMKMMKEIATDVMKDIASEQSF